MIVINVLGSGGGGFAGEVSRGRGNRHAGCTDNISCDGAIRAADSHSREICGGAFGNNVLGRQHHSQRTGPELFCQFIGTFRDAVAEFFHIFCICNVEDQRVILGTALGGKNFGNSLGIQSVSAQTVNSFRGNGHQFAFYQKCRSGADNLRIMVAKNLGFHSLTSFQNILFILLHLP